MGFRQEIPSLFVGRKKKSVSSKGSSVPLIRRVENRLRTRRGTRELKANKDGNANIEMQEKYFFLILVFHKHIFTLVTLYVSIFAEIPLTPVSPPERNDGR